MCQASEEKSEPTWLRQRATSKAARPAPAAMPAPGATLSSENMSLKLAAATSPLKPIVKQSRIKRLRVAILRPVNEFWIHLPRRTPKLLIRVKAKMLSTAASCWVERLIA